MLEKKLSKCDWLDCVYSVPKTRQDNDVADRIDLVYAKIETELLGPIWLGAVCDENHTRQQCGWSYNYVLRWNQYWTIFIDQIGCSVSQKLDRTMMWPIV